MTNPSEPPLILGLGGTPRDGSATERALRLCMGAAEAAGARTRLITAADLLVPIYTPDPAQRTAAALRLVAALRACDGLVIASPAYHGSVSGLVKNALDYTEDLRDDPRVYLDGVPVGLIVCAGGCQAGVQTLTTLRGIVHALRGWPTPMGAAINTATGTFDAQGNWSDAATAQQMHTVAAQVVEFARLRAAARDTVAV